MAGLEFELIYPSGVYGDMTAVYRREKSAVRMFMVEKQGTEEVRVMIRVQTVAMLGVHRGQTAKQGRARRTASRDAQREKKISNTKKGSWRRQWPKNTSQCSISSNRHNRKAMHPLCNYQPNGQ